MSLLNWFENLIKSYQIRSRTVRLMFPALVSFVVMLGAVVVGVAQNPSYIRLETSKTAIETGGRFSIDVYAYAEVPVNAVDITLRFDSTAVEVISVDRGQSVLTIWTQDPIVEKDKVILRGGTFRKGFVKEHKIAKINLIAKKIGQSNVEATDILLLAGDGSGTPVPTASMNNSVASLYIYDKNSDPNSIGVDVAINVITDLDGDGDVTLKDISMFMSAWFSKNNLYDFNGDGRMTFRDFSIILANFFF